MKTCTICNENIECYIEFSDGTIVCSECIREMLFQLAVQMNNLTTGICSLCNEEYDVIDVLNKPVCVDCASFYVRAWFEPESE